MCLDFAFRSTGASLLAAMACSISSPIGSGWLSDRTITDTCCSGIRLRGLSLLFLPFSDFSFYGLSLFAMFYGSTGLRRCRRRCGSPPRFGRERAIWCRSDLCRHQSGGNGRLRAGLSRTALDTYLPAFFAAGALCIVAALITLAISRQVNRRWRETEAANSECE